MKSELNITKNPFLLFYNDKFFDENFYIQLKKEIKDILENENNLKYHTKGEGNNGFYMLGGGNGYNENIKENLYFDDSVNFLKSNYKNYNRFKEIIDYFTSDKFCKYLNSKILKNKFSLRKIKFFSPKSEISLIDFLMFNPVYVSIKLSKYSNGGKINVHRDNPKKYFAFLYYFGFTDNKIRNIGGTQFYKLKNKNIKFEDHAISNEEEMEILKNIEPFDNRFCGFKISENSWHGVKQVNDLPDKCFRMNLQVNLMKVDKYNKNLSFLVNTLKKLKKFLLNN